MSFLICLMLSAAVALTAGRQIKKHANLLYILSTAVSVLLILGTALGISDVFPHLVDVLFWNPLTRGSLATSIFVLVMYAGALPNKSPVRKKLMPIRAELSIIASILTLGHNLSFGQEHFVRMVTDPASMPIPVRIACTCSLLMMAIMIPLFITSFPAVRKKMKARSWKKLQRLAYGFYALIYLHVMALFVPMAAQGRQSAYINIVVFTVVFFIYGAMRIRKSMKRGRWIPAAVAAVAAAVILVVLMPVQTESTDPVVPAVPAETAETEAPSEETSLAMPEESYMDGVYDGRGKGYAAPIRVRVTVEGGRIAAIEVLSQEEDREYWKNAEGLIGTMLEQQSTDVDTVSGATSTSKGIIKAVNDALKQAKVE